MEVEVQFSNTIDNPSVVFMFTSIASGDQNANPISSYGDSFGQFYNSSLSTSNNADIPLTFSLNQNYPNPFNPSTIISYELPNTSKIKLEIFDMMGRNVKTLFDGSKPAEGIIRLGTAQITLVMQ